MIGAGVPEKVNHLRRGSSFLYRILCLRDEMFSRRNRTAAERNCAAGMIPQQIKSGKAGGCRLPQFLIYLKVEKYDKCRIYILTCETIIFIIVTCNNNIRIAEV